jgi:hypothetical protein
MSEIEILLAIAGFIVTALVVAGMILLTPRGQVPVHVDGDDPHHSNLSDATAPRPIPAPREAVR